MYHAYVLYSPSTGKHYYGHTASLESRLSIHNKGKVRSTKSGIPWKLKYSEVFRTRSEAYRREFFSKSIGGYNFLKSKGILSKS